MSNNMLTVGTYISTGSIEVSKALQDGEKFLRWDDIRVMNLWNPKQIQIALPARGNDTELYKSTRKLLGKAQTSSNSVIMKLFLTALALMLATVSAANLDALLRPAFASGRIVNGIEATPGQAPYIVSLQREDGFHFCAGSVFGSNLVLTAAHCLTSSRFNVVAGLHDRTKIYSTTQQVRKVESTKQYKVHEDYKGGVGPNDIGVIYLTTPFVFDKLSRDDSPIISPIKLPSSNYAQLGEGQLFGWGLDASSKSPISLQTLATDIIGYSQCKKELPPGAPLYEHSNVCTHVADKIDGACNGDSGGPLIVNTEEGAELVGVVSWGYSPCHWSTYPSVYTMVSGFGPWIENASEELRQNNDF